METIWKGTTLEGIDTITVKMRDKKCGMSTIFKKLRSLKRYETVHDYFLVQLMDRSGASPSFSKHELYGISKHLTDWDKVERRRVIRELIKDAPNTITW